MPTQTSIELEREQSTLGQIGIMNILPESTFLEVHLWRYLFSLKTELRVQKHSTQLRATHDLVFEPLPSLPILCFSWSRLHLPLRLQDWSLPWTNRIQLR